MNVNIPYEYEQDTLRHLQRALQTALGSTIADDIDTAKLELETVAVVRRQQIYQLATRQVNEMFTGLEAKVMEFEQCRGKLTAVEAAATLTEEIMLRHLLRNVTNLPSTAEANLPREGSGEDDPPPPPYRAVDSPVGQSPPDRKRKP
ncbi:MAG: hypothetical protein M1823_000785 [Watsoniomyces obsoletus]|nr:MAG: hypothetical protein M1823_000785 [Watsoniomyces obsoletus]